MSKKRRLTARQVRYLWAVGAFRRKGGTKRGVTYDRAAAQRARPALGGSKAAGLRSGTGGRAKPDHSATRAARIAAGRAVLDRARLEPTKKALRVSGFLYAVKYRQPGVSVRDAAKGERKRIRDFEARDARDRRIAQAQRYAGMNTKVQRFRGLQEHLGREGAIQAMKTRTQRIAAGRARLSAFRQRQDSLYSGKLF